MKIEGCFLKVRAALKVEFLIKYQGPFKLPGQ
jgi:hypothetical protein